MSTCQIYVARSDMLFRDIPLGERHGGMRRWARLVPAAAAAHGHPAAAAARQAGPPCRLPAAAYTDQLSGLQAEESERAGEVD